MFPGQAEADRLWGDALQLAGDARRCRYSERRSVRSTKTGTPESLHRYLGTAVYRARCSRSASSSMTRSSGGTAPMRAPMRSTATDLTCSACAFESRSSPVFDAGRST